MHNEETDGLRTGVVPVLRHESAGGNVPLDPLSEAVILGRTRPILLALVSSVGDRFDVPHDAGVASAMFVSGVAELLRRTSLPFPESSAADFSEVLWLELKSVLAERGQDLQSDVQDMLLWMFLPHRSCAVVGQHPTATHFMHIWSGLFPSSTCDRDLRQLPEAVIEQGDDCRDGLPQAVRTAIANLARIIRSRNDHLYAFLNRRHCLHVSAG